MTTDKTSQVVLAGDCREVLKTLDAGSVHACVTSPPYFGLRDYNVDGQIGLESTPEEYIAELVAVFREVRRVLRDDGTLWLNLGDSYYSGNGQPTGRDARSPARNFSRTHYRWLDRPGMGLPKKSLVGIPWRVALAMQKDGWTLRSEVIWHRKSSFIEAGVNDRPYRKHETVFMFSKSRRYYFNANLRSLGTVWDIAPERRIKGHNAAFPLELAKNCILSSVPAGGTVLDPFGGAATTAVAASALGRNALVIELNPEYVDLSEDRLGLSRKSA